MTKVTLAEQTLALFSSPRAKRQIEMAHALANMEARLEGKDPPFPSKPMTLGEVGKMLGI